MPITLKQIAECARVDTSTVCRVLNRKQVRISSEKAERIQGVARQLGYRPNISARTTRTGTFHSAVLLLSTKAERSYLTPAMLDGIHDELAAHDMHLTVTKAPDEALSRQNYLPKALSTLMADGFLINYNFHLPAHLIEFAEASRLPVVWINARRAQDAVYPDNFNAARKATEYLLGLGHRRIAYVDTGWTAEEVAVAHESVRDRLAGYCAAMRQAGLTPREIRSPQARMPYDQEVAFHKAWLGEPDRPTALLFYWISEVPSLREAAWGSGLSLPRDLSIASFGSAEMGQAGMHVSAMVEPEYQMGREAVRMLSAKLKSERELMPSRSLEFIWKDEGTCQRPLSIADDSAETP